MVGVVLVSHGQLAVELLKAAELILGPQERAAALSITPGMDVGAQEQQLAALIADYASTGHGVLLLTDMFGGTPTNLCAPFLGQDGVEIISAMNLPMVVKCFNHRARLDFESLCDLLVESGQQGIFRVSEKLAARR